jgi:hypothetical protein
MTKLKHSPDPNQPINFTDPKQRRNLDRQFEKQRKIIQQLRDYYKPQALQRLQDWTRSHEGRKPNRCWRTAHR